MPVFQSAARAPVATRGAAAVAQNLLRILLGQPKVCNKNHSFFDFAQSPTSNEASAAHWHLILVFACTSGGFSLAFLNAPVIAPDMSVYVNDVCGQ